MELMRVKPQRGVLMQIDNDDADCHLSDFSQDLEQLKTLTDCLLSRENTFNFNKLLLYEFICEAVRCGQGQFVLNELESHLEHSIMRFVGEIDDPAMPLDGERQYVSQYYDLYEKFELYWCSLTRAISELMQICTPLQSLIEIENTHGTLWERAMCYLKKDKSLRSDLYNKLLIGALDQIQFYRTGKDVVFCQLRNVVDLLEHLELLPDFETRMQSSTRDHYRQWVIDVFQQHQILDIYLVLKEGINFERECCSKFLHSSSVKVIMDLVLQETLLPHVEDLMPKQMLTEMIKQRNIESLNLLCELYNETELKGRVYDMIIDVCKDIANELVSNYVSLESHTNCKEFMMLLYDFQETLNIAVKPIFNCEADFKGKVKTLWHSALNQSNKSTELVTAGLAKYADAACAIEGPEFMGPDGMVHFVLYIFRYLANKSYFELCFRSFLSIRLLYDQCICPNHIEIISIFKEECGAAYVSKLENLISDIDISQGITDEFQRSHREMLDKLNHAFSVVVLSTDTWLPKKVIDRKLDNENEFVEVDVHESSEIVQIKQRGTIIEDIEEPQSAFVNFYQNNHKNKSLKFLPEFGSATISCTFKNPNSTFGAARVYDFKLSIYQAFCLLAFSKYESINLKYLTNIIQGYNEHLVRQHLGLLNAMPCPLLLFCEYPTLTFETCTTKDIFMLNEDFYNDELFLDFRCKSLDLFSKEMTLVNKNVTFEDIIPALESTIVRYLKQTLEATSTSLFKLCCNNKKYTLSREEFNRVVDSLIEREFIQYNPENRTLLQYVP
ncbi:bifunctional Cullin/Cullin homology domain/Winged helix DNA-binding domain superfamily/Cullin protein [Babesia duncani]|uniref:Bifunctional Cullin/Cullin homology domain/Winged helix DNA-binding domain superfamily/Cullin protein n=1 Tax=Babesia duncani TaxID=323732 RepID=A0AAD9PHN8_9APIC|nr:bifunctional Cullin/Cullin homology domain/Winged helix DNA-binding domain superfamily/Cullin protein [Babesia duncani]KAK2195996.1 bifunctional Cullin/Cullin homology domain/Winged helix DNA-binding domain superfamily/Cullin protein [Babesia duncani]